MLLFFLFLPAVFRTIASVIVLTIHLVEILGAVYWTHMLMEYKDIQTTWRRDCYSRIYSTLYHVNNAMTNNFIQTFVFFYSTCLRYQCDYLLYFLNRINNCSENLLAYWKHLLGLLSSSDGCGSPLTSDLHCLIVEHYNEFYWRFFFAQVI